MRLFDLLYRFVTLPKVWLAVPLHRFRGTITAWFLLLKGASKQSNRLVSA